MSGRDRRRDGEALTHRAVGVGYSFAAMITLALALLLFGRMGSGVVSQAERHITDFVAPVMSMVSAPVTATRQAGERVQAYFDLHAANERLRLENERLRQWAAIAQALEEENARFRALNRLKLDPRITYLTARVIGDAGGPFVRTLLVNVGEADGARSGAAVIDGDGLIGRVVATGDGASRVLLITDLNSRIPVTVEPGGWRGALTGDNSGRPRLDFLPATARPEIGARVVTSGHGGLLPPGLPAGVIESLDGGAPRVAPYSDPETAEYVRVLRFERELAIPEGAIDLHVGPPPAAAREPELPPIAPEDAPDRFRLDQAPAPRP